MHPFSALLAPAISRPVVRLGACFRAVPGVVQIRGARQSTRWTLASIVLLSLASADVRAATINILFVGNSFTYGHADPVQSYNSANVTDANGTGYGGVPGIFKKMASQTGFACNVTIEAVANYTLENHYDDESSIIANSKWNTVVLQELSTNPLPTAHGGDPSNFDTYASALRSLVLSKNSAAGIYLYQTWASPTSVVNQDYDPGLTGLQEMQSDLHSAYSYADQTYGFNGVAPVGDAFLQAIDQGFATYDPTNSSIPGYDLWDATDIRHASVYGSYLAAAVLYAELTGKNPTLLPYTGSAAQSFGISSADALTLETVAAEMVPEPSEKSILLLCIGIALLCRAPKRVPAARAIYVRPGSSAD